MNPIKMLSCAAIVAATALTACVDDSYDLHDVDKTAQFRVDNLIVPINIDQIELKSIIDETNTIMVVDGVYSYVTDGTFTSSPLSVPSIHVSVGDINPTKVDFEMIEGVAGLPVPNIDISYHIAHEIASNLDFEGGNIDKAVCDISAIYADVVFRITINTDIFRDVASYLDLKGIKIILPKHLMLESSSIPGKYNPTTGILALDDFRVSTDTDAQLTLKFSGLEVEKDTFNADTHTLSVHEHIGISDGTFFMPAAAIKSGATFPADVSINIDYYVSDFSVNAVSGEIAYNIDGIDIPTVSLNNMPDFLKQAGTDLIFANPQLYLGATNPFEQYGMYARTGLSITTNRHGESTVTYTADAPITIGKDGVCVDNRYNFCIAPEMPAHPDASFPSPQFVKFSNLGRVLAGDGTPSSLKVSLIDPAIPRQKVDRFRLGVDYPGVEGRYKFIAPFQLESGSMIIYSESFNDWWSEDLDNLTIEYLEITAEVSTDIPVAAKATGYPLDRDGKRIPDAEIEGADIPANAVNAPITIRVKMPQGGIRGLGGMTFTAIATSAGGAGLSPDMKIEIKKIRPRVSGYYRDNIKI